MGDKTAIGWTEATLNPSTGCDRTSPGCDHCYALTMAGRLKAMGSPRYQNDGDPHTSGPGFGLTLHPDVLDQAIRWKRPRRIFVNSMSDLYHQDVPVEFIAQLLAVVELTPQHTYQVLTKRAQRMAKVMADATTKALAFSAVNRRLGVDPAAHVDIDNVTSSQVRDLGRAIRKARDAAGVADVWPLPNLWLGVSIESDAYSWRANHLRQTPAAVRFLSLEPLLGPLPSLRLDDIDWVIIGCESGPERRPCDVDWVRPIVERCRVGVPCPACGGSGSLPAYGEAPGGQACECQYGPHPGRKPVSVFVKQLSIDGVVVKDVDRFPEDLQIQEFPG